MAKIKQGILGGLSGKIGSVVGTSWKGRAILKALPLSVANPKTEGQVKQRTSFSGISKLISLLLTFIVRPVYNPIAGNITGANKMSSQNKLMFDGTGAFDPSKSFIGGGTLLHDQVSSASNDFGNGEMFVNWNDSSAGGSPRKNDTVHIFCMSADGETVYASSQVATRSAEQMSIFLIQGPEISAVPENVWFFIAFVDASGREVSIQAAPIEILVGPV